MLNAGIGDAMVVHAYASTATVANFLSYASDHFNYVSTISKKPVWVTEYNLLGAEQSAAQSAFIGDMLTMMRNDLNVQFACVHNLAAAGSNNNAITWSASTAAWGTWPWAGTATALVTVFAQVGSVSTRLATAHELGRVPWAQWWAIVTLPHTPSLRTWGAPVLSATLLMLACLLLRRICWRRCKFC